MQPISRPVLVLHSDAAFRERLQAITHERFQVRVLEDWEAMRGALRIAPPGALAVVDPYFDAGTRGGLSPELRAVLLEAPSAAVLAALELEPGRAPDLLLLAEWGIREVIALGEEDTPEAMARRLRAAQARPLQHLLERSLPSTVSGRARALLNGAAEVVAEGGHGRDLAAALGLSERTLLRWTAQADLPPPRRVLAWIRVLRAAELLSDRSHTVMAVARSCGYTSDSSLRRAMQDFTGMLLPELRARGALATASRIFLRELAQLRAEGRVVRQARRHQEVGAK